MAYRNKVEGGFSGGLRANVPARATRQLAAGPFDVSAVSTSSASMTLADALITGLLIIYPTVATVVAIMVALTMLNPVAGI